MCMHFDHAPDNPRFKKKTDQLDLDFEPEPDNSAEEAERNKILEELRRYGNVNPDLRKKDGEWYVGNMSLDAWRILVRNDKHTSTNDAWPNQGHP